MRVLVTGATGFIGSRLCEVMALTGASQVRALVHSTASTWRIARFPLDFVMGDLCDSEAVNRAVKGCDAIVHLAWGDRAVMRQGLENILRAAADQGVSRFVHMSSVAVYGNNPPPQSVTEAAPAVRTDNAYGNDKLDQERRVLKYWKRQNLPVVVLRPPNVYGPYSPFTTNLIARLRSGTLPVVDAGRNPMNLVYVDNLVEATLLALRKPAAVGETFFVTDAQTVTWERCLRDHASLINTSVPAVTSAALVPPPRVRVIRDSITLLPRVLLSGDLRTVLRRIPLVDRMERTLYRRFQSLSGDTKQSLRLFINGTNVVEKNGTSARCFSTTDNLIAAQRRNVAHSSEKARRLLGYTAPVSYEEGMVLTEAWLRFARII